MATPSVSPSTSTDEGDVDSQANAAEKNVLQTLASIKAQISSVLEGLQQAHLSATAAGAAAATGTDSTMSTPTSKSRPVSAPQPEKVETEEKPGQELSREEVKAQREAAKAAKAARKKKGGGGGETSGEPAPPKPTNSTPKEKKPQTQKVEKRSVSNPPQQGEKSSVPSKSKSSQGPETKPPTDRPGPATPGKESSVPPVSTEPSQAKGRISFDSQVDKVHPKFRELGLKYANHIYRGSNARTRALLSTTKSYILNTYRTPEGKGFKHDLSAQLQIQFEGLKLYRPHAVGMTTAIDGINEAIRSLAEDGPSEVEYREELESWMDTFIEEKVTKAVEAVAQKGVDKIENGDTILTFSLTEAVYEAFKLAGEQGKRFTLILAITRPRAETHNYLGEYDQLRAKLGGAVVKNGQVNISCINLSSIMSFIPTVDKVFLGGHALFTTGGVMAHAGASSVALCAGSHNIPVIFFCETYKFCDKSPTDAFYSDIFPENKFGFSSWKDRDSGEGVEKATDGPVMAKIFYDVTPVDLVTCVITDIDMLPSSSVPVVLRVQETRPLIKCL